MSEMEAGASAVLDKAAAVRPLPVGLPPTELARARAIRQTPETSGASGPGLKLPTISVVIPTLNEAKNLPILLPRLSPWIHEVIIVDGRSTDNTVEVARQLLKDVKIVLCETPGKGAAMRAGFNAATGDIIVVLDADGSMDPDQILTFAATLVAGADFVKGSRFIQGGGTDDMTWFRQFGNWALTQAVRVLYGGVFSDLCYGYIGFWRRHLPIFDSTADGFEIETLLNVRAMKAGLNIVEVASFEYPRLHGESNLRAIPDGIRVLKTILTERFQSTAVGAGAR